MKYPALVLLVLGVASLARAESYRIFCVAADTPSIESIYPAFKDGNLSGTAIDGKKITLKEYTVLQLDPSGTAEIDQTYPVEYAQSYRDDGTPQEPTARKVGIQAKIQKLPDGNIRISYISTTLVQWIFYGPKKNFLQPIFKTKEIQSVCMLGIGQMAILGSVRREHTSTPEDASGSSDSQESFFWAIQRINPPPLNAVR